MDAATFVDEFLTSVENLPEEIHHLFEEMTERESGFRDLKSNIDVEHDSLKKIIKASSFSKPSDKEIATIDRVQACFSQAERLLEEKSALADRSLTLLERTIRRLDGDLSRVQNDPEAQELAMSVGLVLNPTAEYGSMSQHSSSYAINGLGGSLLGRPSTPPLVGSLAAALPTPSPEKHLEANKRKSHATPGSSLAFPATTFPQSSLGAHPSNFAPHLSPASSVSTSPSLSHHVGLKKTGSHSASNLLKSTLTRKRPFSDLEDDADALKRLGPGARPWGPGARASGPSADRRESTPEADDTPYCTCNQPSYGNMVACDSDDCPYEWFHYGCVGLTEPPKGLWYCPTCVGAGSPKKKKRKTPILE